MESFRKRSSCAELYLESESRSQTGSTLGIRLGIEKSYENATRLPLHFDCQTGIRKSHINQALPPLVQKPETDHPRCRAKRQVCQERTRSVPVAVWAAGGGACREGDIHDKGLTHVAGWRGMWREDVRQSAHPVPSAGGSVCIKQQPPRTLYIVHIMHCCVAQEHAWRCSLPGRRSATVAGA